MKKLASLLVAASLLLPALPAFAATGDVLGNIYSTDILATINGVPIESYNIGGRTVIVAEDLSNQGYGFSCTYDNGQRLLTVSSRWSAPDPTLSAERGTPGQVLGSVYESDIRVLFNGQPVTSYNIGGRTAICIEDLGQPDGGPNQAYGYSKYLANYVWDGDSRTIALNTFLSNSHEIMGLEAPSYQFFSTDNVLQAECDPMNPYYSSFGVRDGATFRFTDEFIASKRTIVPCYLELNGVSHQVGLCLVDDSRDFDEPIYFIEDVGATLQLLRDARPAPVPYQQALELVTSRYKVESRSENDTYTVLTLSKDSPDERYVVALKKTGGYLLLDYYSQPGVTAALDGSTVTVSVYPWTNPHGEAVTMTTRYELHGYQF